MPKNCVFRTNNILEGLSTLFHQNKRHVYIIMGKGGDSSTMELNPRLNLLLVLKISHLT